MGSDRIDRLNLRPYIRCIPPVVELDAYTRMVCYPFADQTLRRRVAAMAVDDQDAFKALLPHCIENVAHYLHVGLHTQTDCSRERSKIRRDNVRYHGKQRHAQ